ncbi:MAG TPA: hypothetical protein VLQ93_18315, partial [Myxococcaceae bacterium]|nr:hypothetical protein [Myxococcaceae bacterium]
MLTSLLLLSGCTPAGPRRPPLGYGSAHRVYRPLTPPSHPEAREREEGSRFVRLPTDFAPVRVGEAEFSLAMAGLLLEVPLRVVPSRRPLYASRALTVASVDLEGEAWRSELARDSGGFCERRGTPGDCLGL